MHTSGVNMSNVETIVTVDLEEYSNGYIATSKGMNGLFVANESFDRIVAIIPAAISLLMKAQYGKEFIVKEQRDAHGDPKGTRPVGKRIFSARQVA